MSLGMKSVDEFYTLTSDEALFCKSLYGTPPQFNDEQLSTNKEAHTSSLVESPKKRVHKKMQKASASTKNQGKTEEAVNLAELITSIRLKNHLTRGELARLVMLSEEIIQLLEMEVIGIEHLIDQERDMLKRELKALWHEGKTSVRKGKRKTHKSVSFTDQEDAEHQAISVQTNSFQ